MDDPPSLRSYGGMNLLPRPSCVPSVRRQKHLYGRFRFAFGNRPARVTVPKVEMVNFTGSGGNPSYNPSTGRLSLGGTFVAGMVMRAQIKISNWDGKTKFQFVQGIRRQYTLTYTNGTKETVFVWGAPGKFCLDNGDPYESEEVSGSNTFTTITTDSPFIQFNNISDLAAAGVRKIEFQDEFEMFVGYRLEIYPERKALGVLRWGWSAIIQINADGSSSLSSGTGTGTPTGTSVNTMPSYDCTATNTSD